MPGISSFRYYIFQFTNRLWFLSCHFVDWHFLCIENSLWKEDHKYNSFSCTKQSRSYANGANGRAGDFWLKDWDCCENKSHSATGLGSVDLATWNMIKSWRNCLSPLFLHCDTHLLSAIETISKSRLKCIQRLKSLKRTEAEVACLPVWS